jgi:hypothetical protein
MGAKGKSAKLSVTAPARAVKRGEFRGLDVIAPSLPCVVDHLLAASDVLRHVQRAAAKWASPDLVARVEDVAAGVNEVFALMARLQQSLAEVTRLYGSAVLAEMSKHPGLIYGFEDQNNPPASEGETLAVRAGARHGQTERHRRASR